MQNNKPTLAGMMTLGDYPQRIYPNLCITAIAVNGTVLQPDDGGERFIDNKRYEGTIAEMLEGALGVRCPQRENESRDSRRKTHRHPRISGNRGTRNNH